MWKRIGMAAAIAVLAAVEASAADDTTGSLVARGADILTRDCGGCHAVGRQGDSPLAKAPHFRELGQRFPIESLAEALAEGIMTGHPEMPELSYEPPDIDAILAYLEDIQAKQ